MHSKVMLGFAITCEIAEHVGTKPSEHFVRKRWFQGVKGPQESADQGGEIPPECVTTVDDSLYHGSEAWTRKGSL